jgi:putative ABC transport system substrate-binding protein
MEPNSRRAFVAGGSALILTPLAAQVQQAGKVYRIGAFHVGDHVPPGLRTLTAGLAARGYEEGRNVQLDFRNLATEEAAHDTAKALVGNRVDLIVAFGNPAVRAAKAATSETPIVMVHATDPVAAQFVSSLARPGGNVTGFVFFAVSPGKHLELMREIVPGLRRVLVLTDPGDPVSPPQLAEMRAAAGTLRSLELVAREASEHIDLERIFGSLKQGDVDGIVSASVNLQIRFTSRLIRLALGKRLPLASYRKEAAQQGALFSYAPDDAAVGRRAAEYVDRILKGAKPADLPIEQPTKFELVINLKTAKALGLTIRPSLLLRADQVIE